MANQFTLISKQEARALGHKRWFNGIPCKAGHITERWVTPSCCCECMRLRNLVYSRANPEYFKEQRDRWAKANPEKAKAIQKRYTERHAEKVAEKNRRWASKQHRENYQTDPVFRARKNAATKLWAEQNHERNTAHKRAWAERNRKVESDKALARRRADPDKVKAASAANKAMRKAAIGRFNADDIQMLLEQQSYRCAAPHCRIDVLRDFHCDHILPLSRGGTNSPDNIQILCSACNLTKNDRTMEEWQAARDARQARDASVRPYRIDAARHTDTY
jgi:5-methylcytosine-specific restriction endonuclease McrA